MSQTNDKKNNLRSIANGFTPTSDEYWKISFNHEDHLISFDFAHKMETIYTRSICKVRAWRVPLILTAYFDFFLFPCSLSNTYFHFARNHDLLLIHIACMRSPFPGTDFLLLFFSPRPKIHKKYIT